MNPDQLAKYRHNTHTGISISMQSKYCKGCKKPRSIPAGTITLPKFCHHCTKDPYILFKTRSETLEHGPWYDRKGFELNGTKGFLKAYEDRSVLGSCVVSSSGLALHRYAVARIENRLQDGSVLFCPSMIISVQPLGEDRADYRTNECKTPDTFHLGSSV